MPANQLRSVLLSLLFGAACGPGQPADPGETDDTGEGPASTATGEPQDSTGGAPTTGGPGTASSGDPTGETTGGPGECPPGQVPFTQRWSSVIAPPLESATIDYLSDMVTLSGGRHVHAFSLGEPTSDLRAVGVLFTSPDGEPLGLHTGAFTERSPRLHALAREADDHVVVAGEHWGLGEEPPRTWVARFTGDGLVVAEGEVVQPSSSGVALGLLDAPLLLGFDVPAQQMQAVKLGPGGFEPAWTVALAEPGVDPGAVAVRDDGTALLAFDGAVAGEFTWTGLHVVDAAGATVWHRELAGLPLGRVFDAVAIPDGWVVMRPDRSTASVQLLAFAAADGSALWELELATLDAAGTPTANAMHLTGDHLTIPVIRALSGAPNEPLLERAVEVHRVSLQGAPIDVTPLPGAAASLGPLAIASAIGQCDELVIRVANETHPQHGPELQLSAWTP